MDGCTACRGGGALARETTIGTLASSAVDGLVSVMMNDVVYEGDGMITIMSLRFLHGHFAQIVGSILPSPLPPARCRTTGRCEVRRVATFVHRNTIDQIASGFVEMMRALRYPRFISLNSFIHPNYALMSDALLWLYHRFE